MERKINERRRPPALGILRGSARIATLGRMAAPVSRRVVFVTSKYWHVTSRLGVHFLAESFARGGWDVLFITTHMSSLAAVFGKRRRLVRRARREANRLVVADGVASYVWYTLWQPVNLRIDVLNRATMGLFRRY